MENNKELTLEERTKHLELFFKKLQGLNLNTEILSQKYAEPLKEATYSFSNKDNTACGAGELLKTVLRILTPTALKLNELLPEEKRVSKESIIKVCLLSQISKALMVSPNDNQWEIDKRGILYKFNDFPYALKMGMRSVAICMECGIELNENELEAISNIDRDDDKQVKFFSSPLATVLRQAMEITDVIIRKSIG